MTIARNFSSALSRRTLLVLAAAFLAFAATLSTAPRASAAVKFKVVTEVVVTGGETRIAVNLSTGRRVAAKFKPRSVSVRAAGMKISLKRQATASAAAGYKTTWRSKAFTGSQAASLQALGGKNVKVTIKARKATSIRSSKVTVQIGGGGGTTPGPLFAAPGRDLVGNEAFNHLSQYFLNSALSDCQAGPWPLCAVEERYAHCPNGYWLYQRTSGTGADINSGGNFTVTGANVFANGAWAVSYDNNYGASYIWQVDVNGIATGTYIFGGSSSPIGPMYWSRPAVSWNYTSGVCS